MAKAQPPGRTQPDGDPPPARPTPEAARHARLAAALRDNLHRRKTQARERAAPPPEVASPLGPDADDT